MVFLIHTELRCSVNHTSDSHRDKLMISSHFESLGQNRRDGAAQIQLRTPSGTTKYYVVSLHNSKANYRIHRHPPFYELRGEVIHALGKLGFVFERWHFATNLPRSSFVMLCYWLCYVPVWLIIMLTGHISVEMSRQNLRNSHRS